MGTQKGSASGNSAEDEFDPWDASPRQAWDDGAASAMTAAVLPNNAETTEIEIVGDCPRCRHKTRWTHALRGVVGQTPSTAKALETFRAEAGIPEAAKTEPITGQCACGYAHPKRPEGESGCGAPFSLLVSWTPSSDKRKRNREAAVHKSPTLTTGFELADARDIARSQRGELVDVRKSAENWRTGLAALLAVLTTTLFIKGKSSIDDIDPGWRWGVIVPLIIAGLTALFGAYRAIRAAYGLPEEQWLRAGKGLGKYGSLSAWRHAFAKGSAKDLGWAKRATVTSLLLIGFAIVWTWLAPGPPPPAFVKATFTSAKEPVCGELKRADGGTVVIKEDDQHTVTKPFKELTSVKVVKSCD